MSRGRPSTVRHLSQERKVGYAGAWMSLLLPLLGAALIILLLLEVPALDWAVLLTAAIAAMTMSIGVAVRQWLSERPK